MINVIYCEEHRVILAVNCNCQNGFHKHYDESGEEIFIEGVLISGIDEDSYNGSVNFTTKDGTIVNNSEEWVIYLKKYIP